MLINLIKNAMKFTISGFVRVSIAFDYAKQMLIVHVEDSGKGIDPSDLCKLFRRFGKLE